MLFRTVGLYRPRLDRIASIRSRNPEEGFTWASAPIVGADDQPRWTPDLPQWGQGSASGRSRFAIVWISSHWARHWEHSYS